MMSAMIHHVVVVSLPLSILAYPLFPSSPFFSLFVSFLLFFSLGLLAVSN